MRKAFVLIIVVFVAVALLAAVTPAPANAWYPECELTAYWGWHSWGQNVYCLFIIYADIIGTGGR